MPVDRTALDAAVATLEASADKIALLHDSNVSAQAASDTASKAAAETQAALDAGIAQLSVDAAKVADEAKALAESAAQ